jgi:CRP/FNR family cyclic AMP-dependent transcriptional regulator
MTVQERSVLGAQLFLRGLPPGQLARLAELCHHAAVPCGRRLFEEGSAATRFWLIDAGQAALDVFVPGQGRVTIECLGRGDVLGLSWLVPPHQWQFGAVTTQPMQAFEFDAVAVRTACAADPVLGFELMRRFTAVSAHRLHATRRRLLEACSAPASTDK